MGWSITGDVPRQLTKYIIIAAPHSSNFDFIIGLLVRSVLNFKSGFLGKKELFRFPFGILFRKLGGYPVDRSVSSKVVEQVVELIKKEEHFVLAIAPEGTRRQVTRWKTGFYHIALQAGIPLVMAALDYEKRMVTFAEPLYLTGNTTTDENAINDFFKNAKGKNHNAAPFLLSK